MDCWAVGLISFRSWRFSDDRFFALFGAGFWLLAVHRFALAAVGAVDGTRHYFYAIRLLGILLVIVAIVDRNRA